ncbi:MAG: hypothetical protein AAF388_19470 [Bacteroidota bacterium]
MSTRKFLFFILSVVGLFACHPNSQAPTDQNFSESSQVDNSIDIPEFAIPVLQSLTDSIKLDSSMVILGDFNADTREDMSALIENKHNRKTGVIIIHNQQVPDFKIFGAGKTVNGIDDLAWIDIFQSIPNGDTITPTLVDSISGDIIGPNLKKAFVLLGEGIFMHIDEASGGGIIFWDGEKYQWYHKE